MTGTLYCPEHPQTCLRMSSGNSWKRDSLLRTIRPQSAQFHVDGGRHHCNRTCFYFDLCAFGNVEQKVCYFRVVSARKTIVRFLNVPRQTVSDEICRF
ncbi:hypothetical protein TNCV_4564971 [Trichonephila clavipes]|nr:hypothetical protein TNCV_4564971 [Trichonephila clavipes]